MSKLANEAFMSLLTNIEDLLPEDESIDELTVNVSYDQVEVEDPKIEDKTIKKAYPNFKIFLKKRFK